MLKRLDIVNMLKTIDVNKFEGNGPTSMYFSFDGGMKSATFSLSTQDDFIIVSTGNFIFKRKYKIYKKEL